ncbi:hypothetical protein OS493_018316 [Desmophyllum pertusum]|uniref:Uncharacterized protein n=1 Tax=Desmophyllum pertusum TaxID=174260 RepID=A0A9W9YBZ5_9CNID|nr:hypothetical protein OS493_018316 [Desmophyllum pertusum]
MGACTSAVTTTGSSSVTVVSSHNAESRLTSARQGGNVTASYKAFHLQENPGVQTQGQSRINRVGDSKGLVPSTSQENWEPKGHSSSPTSVATVSISTSAIATTTHRDLHITPENPFGVIGEVATATTAFQTEAAVPEFTPSQQEAGLLQNRAPSSSAEGASSGLLPSPRERKQVQVPLL